jgi:DNA-binding transcriptional LysR family regulator
VAVADELNFTKAAQKLRVAQPALSRQIRQLEDEIGAPLFERGARGAKLTLAGAAFLVEARALVSQSAKAIRVAQTFRDATPRSLNVGYAWGLFHSLVPKVIARFHRKRRDVPVNLFDMTAPQQSAAILEDRLDAGFIGFEQDAAGPHLARKNIGSCAFILALPQDHRAAKSKSVDLRSLAEESFCVISTENFPGAAHCAMQACAAAGFRPKILQTAARGVTMLGMVAANRGIAILPEPLSDLPHPGVTFRPMRDPYHSDLYVVWQARNSGELIAEFLNAADAQ